MRLLDWKEHEAAVRAEESRLISESDFEGLRILDDRFRRLKILSDFRITLSLRDLAHLDISVSRDPLVHVFRVRNDIRIMSREARNSELVANAPRFENLP
jgi:hypothetical protein